MYLYSLRDLSIYTIALHFGDASRSMRRIKEKLPISISKEIVQTINVMNRGFTDKDLIRLGKINLQIDELDMIGLKVNKCKSMAFLKNQPIRKFKLTHSEAVSSLDDLQSFLNVEYLRELNLSFLSKSLEIKKSHCKYFKSLTKLTLQKTQIRNNDFLVICEELSNLTELIVKEIESFNFSASSKLKNLNSFQFTDTRSGRNILESLKKSRSLKEIYLDCFSKITLHDLEKYFFNGSWNLEKFVFHIGHWELGWLDKYFQRCVRNKKKEQTNKSNN